MKVKYFAWVRERIGKAEETIEPPADVRTVDDLIGWLAAARRDLCLRLRDAAGDPRRDRPRPCQTGRDDRRRPRDRVLSADDRRLSMASSMACMPPSPSASRKPISTSRAKSRR